MSERTALRASAAHVFVDDLDRPQLDDRDEHHLARVLRLRDGEVVTVGDGRGSWRTARWHRSGPIVDGPSVTVPAPPTVTIAAAIPKGDRLDWMVQKLVEVGVMCIVLVDCRRSVVRWQPERRTAQRRKRHIDCAHCRLNPDKLRHRTRRDLTRRIPQPHRVRRGTDAPTQQP